jgi:hypothetical protein
MTLERQVMASMFRVHHQSARNDRVDRFRFRMRERWTDRLRYVSRTWLSPTRRHIELVALPDRLRWAYFPLAWAVDYAALPVWRIVRPLAHRRQRGEGA